MSSSDKKNHHRLSSIIKNTILSIIALVVVNAVQQLVVYPYLSKQMGTGPFGNVLFVLAVVSIIATSAGLAVNNTRLVAQKRYECNNGDAIITIILFILGGIIAVVLTLNSYFEDSISVVLVVFLLIFTTLKYYSDVEYRLSLNYKRYVFYYLSITAGYLLGIITYRWFHSWIFTLLIGEVLGFVFILITGNVYKNPLLMSNNIKIFFKNSCTLFFSYLLYNSVLNLDRILLKFILGSEIVAIFYVSSLIGKTIAMLIGPINSIAISYLSKKEEPINLRFFFIITIGTIVISSLFYLFTNLITPIFTRFVYPDIYDLVVLYSPLANLSQIICFAGSFLLTIILTITDNKWQIIVQSVYVLLFVGLCLIFSKELQLTGFIIGTVIANTIRLLLTIIIGIYYSYKTQFRIIGTLR